MTPRIAANPNSIKATAKSLLDAREQYHGTTVAVGHETLRLAAAPGHAAAGAAVGVASFKVVMARVEFDVWQQSHAMAITAMRFAAADGAGGAAYGDFLLRYYGRGVKAFTSNVSQALKLGIKLRVRHIAYHPNKVPDIKRLEKLKGVNKAAKRFGAFSGVVGKVLSAAAIAENFNKGADTQFHADRRRNDLSEWQLQARAVLAGLAHAAETIGELGGAAIAVSLAALLGVAGAVAGMIGGPVGVVLGAVAGTVVGAAAGMFGGFVGKKIGAMIAPQIRKLIDAPLLNVGHSPGALDAKVSPSLA